MSPFDFANSINTGTDDVMQTPEDEKAYSGFVVNRALSYFADTIFHANEMNSKHQLDARLQYDFLRLSVKKRKRFSKWFKASKEDEDAIKVIMRKYGYSEHRAREALRILSPERVKALREQQSPGGRKK